MWKLILLFVVLTPGIAFTVPIKKMFRGVSPNLLVAAVHALIFGVIVNVFRVTEGFQDTFDWGALTTCPAGSITLSNGECEVCPPGTISYAGDNQCSPCPSGQSSSDRTQCENLQAPTGGSIFPEDVIPRIPEEVKCPVGYILNEDKRSCVLDTRGSVFSGSETTGGSIFPEDVIPRIPEESHCARGYVFNSNKTECVKDTTDFWWWLEGWFDDGVVCRAGYTLSADGKSCDLCPSGTYSNRGATQCMPCPSGISSEDRTVCVRDEPTLIDGPECPPGTVRNQNGGCSGFRIDCNPGFRPNEYNTECVPYPNDPRLISSVVVEKSYDATLIINRIDSLIKSFEEKEQLNQKIGSEARAKLSTEKGSLRNLQSELRSIGLQINEAAAAVRADKIKIKNTQDAARAAETTVNGARTAFRSSTQRGSSFAGSAKTLNTQLTAAKSLLSFDASKIKIDNNMINITSGSLRNAKAQLGSALAAKTAALKTKNSGLITSTTKAVIDVNTQISRLTSQITAGSSRVEINTLKMGSNNLTKLKIESSLKEINTAIEGLIRAIDSDRIKLDNAEKAFTAAMNAVDAAQAQLSADIERGSSLTNRKGSINAEISQGSLRVTEYDNAIYQSGSLSAEYSERLMVARNKLSQANSAQTSGSTGVFEDIMKWLTTV